jgi:aldehyde:ferredoxin oxidoreductase
MSINTGQLLRVNLSTGKISAEPVPEQIARDFVGGRGYGLKYLYDELKPGADPLGPDNKLIIASGALGGTPVFTVGRWMTITKSPLTGAFARSVGGGDFAAWIKFAGYDFMIIEGRADKPSYLHITPDGCQIMDAADLWGQETLPAQETLQERHGKKNTRTICIGPAAEKLVKYAGIFCDRRTAGRCGTGTVMASKNLKAVAITAARITLPVADPAALKALVKEQAAIYKTSKGFQHHKEWGTTDTQDVTNSIGVFPMRNFREGQHPEFEKISGKAYRVLRTGEFGCYLCPANCGKAHLVKDGPYAGAYSEGPEYESLWVFTGPIGSSDIKATIAADQVCDDLGMDTISAGGCIGFAYELYEKGIITKEDTGGLELVYGDPSPVLPLLRMIAAREGIGDILAEGTKAAAAHFGHGSDVYAIHVKGLELPAYEPRGAKTQGYNYVTASIGANHCYGYSGQDIFGAPFPRPSDRFAEAENADLVIFNQNGAARGDVCIACGFSGGWGWHQLLPGMLKAVRGFDEIGEPAYFDQVGERLFNLERAFNVREGLGRKDDTLPPRMRTEPLHTIDAPGEGQIVREQDAFLDNYYSLRGWTKEGVPTKETLDKLNLGFAAKNMP